MFPSLVQVDPSDNPLDRTNYDWAQYKLGADEVGAKTLIGQLAQELISFQTLGAQLGAFNSFKGASQGGQAADRW